MKNLILVLGLFFIFSCSKTDSSTVQAPVNATPSNPVAPVVTTPSVLVYPVKMLDSFSSINKTTSWYLTNNAFSGVVDVTRTKYWGFQLLNGSYIPYNTSTTGSWDPNNNYYWQDFGGYIYSDLNKDGNKDLFVYYLKAPWPTNLAGLSLFSEYDINPNNYDLQKGLTQPRKLALADFNNDGYNEVMMFSSGYDGAPFPGDSLAYFNVRNKTYRFLSQDIGYFHGGATGDINNDGKTDILGSSGGSMVIPIHLMSYTNLGNENFQLNKSIFQGFGASGNDNFYTVELMDLNKDDKLDLVLGGNGIAIVVPQVNGIFTRSNAKVLPVASNQAPLDFDFLDLNGDGNLDIIATSTINNYQGYSVSIFINNNGNYEDKTADYLDKYNFPSANGTWIKWLYLYDVDGDGDLDFVGDGYFGDFVANSHYGVKRVYWKNNSGKFIYTEER